MQLLKLLGDGMEIILMVINLEGSLTEGRKLSPLNTQCAPLTHFLKRSNFGSRSLGEVSRGNLACNSKGGAI